MNKRKATTAIAGVVMMASLLLSPRGALASVCQVFSNSWTERAVCRHAGDGVDYARSWGSGGQCSPDGVWCTVKSINAWLMVTTQNHPRAIAVGMKQNGDFITGCTATDDVYDNYPTYDTTGCSAAVKHSLTLYY